MRGQENVGQGKDSLAKMSQVIQVRPQPADLTAMAAGLQSQFTDSTHEELFHKGCSDCTSCKIFPAACLRKRFGDQKGQQMGK